MPNEEEQRPKGEGVLDQAGGPIEAKAPESLGSQELPVNKGFLSKFKPSRHLIQQMERDVRGVSRDRMPNVVLGSTATQPLTGKDAGEKTVAKDEIAQNVGCPSRGRSH